MVSQTAQICEYLIQCRRRWTSTGGGTAHLSRRTHFPPEHRPEKGSTSRLPQADRVRMNPKTRGSSRPPRKRGLSGSRTDCNRSVPVFRRPVPRIPDSLRVFTVDESGKILYNRRYGNIPVDYFQNAFRKNLPGHGDSAPPLPYTERILP